MSYIPKIITFNNNIVTQSNSALGWSTYVPEVHNVYLNQTVGGTITANPLTGYSGDMVTLSNTANANYEFDSYSVTGATLTGRKFTFEDSDVTAQGNFIKNGSAELYNNGLDHLYVGIGGTDHKTRTINVPITGYDYITIKFNFWQYPAMSRTDGALEYQIYSNDNLKTWGWHISNHYWDADNLTTDGGLSYKYGNIGHTFTAVDGSATLIGQVANYFNTHSAAATVSSSPHRQRLIISMKDNMVSAYFYDNQRFVGSGPYWGGKTSITGYDLHAISNRMYSAGIYNFKIGGFDRFDNALSW